MGESKERLPIERSIKILKKNYQEIPTVGAWANIMGYSSPKIFSNDFREYFQSRPQSVLISFRSRKAVKLLRVSDLTNYEIACKLKVSNEKGLYQFVKRQTGFSPSQIANLKEKDCKNVLKKLCSNIK